MPSLLLCLLAAFAFGAFLFFSRFAFGTAVAVIAVVMAVIVAMVAFAFRTAAP